MTDTQEWLFRIGILVAGAILIFAILWIGRPRKRSANVLKCCRESSVVGTTTATCTPFIAAMKAARNATSVLPKPTSPQTSRSIGRPAPRSSRTASMAFA